MTTAKKLRRVRVGQCPDCGHLFQFQRRSAQDIKAGVHLQICTHCFSALNGHTLTSHLEEKTP